MINNYENFNTDYIKNDNVKKNLNGTNFLPYKIENKKGIYLGFGHHHVGLTGGPKTGRLLASLVAGLTPNQNMSAYKPERFAVR